MPNARPLPRMTCAVRVNPGGSHAHKPFYPDPCGRPRPYPAALPEAPAPGRPRPQVYRRPPVGRAALRRQPHQFPGRRLRRPARRPFGLRYGGGLAPGSYRWVKETYRKRFAIETTYRQLGQARIRTSTRDPLLRFLYVAVALILRNVWVWLHWQVLAQRRRGGRRVDTNRLPFRTLLLWLQHWAEGCLGVRDEIHAKYPLYG
jgi:hypothetical protein